MTTTTQEPIGQDQSSQDSATNIGSPSTSGAGNDSNGRDDRGRFTKGNRGGPGNPFARKVGKLRKVLLDTVTADDMVKIAHTLVFMATGGDLQAIKLLLQYTVGKPADTINPDRLDVDEAERFEETSAMQKGLLQAALAPEPEFALEIARAVRPALAQSFGGRLKGMFEQDAVAERAQAEAERKEAARAEQRREKARARRDAQRSPSPNGVVPEALAADGLDLEAPFAGLERGAPSTNGQDGDGQITEESVMGDATDLEQGSNGHESAPSANGDREDSEGPMPSANGTPEGKEADGPSANGKKALAQQMSELLRLLTGRNGPGKGLAP